jgi:diphthamide synthase subunit DPH2
MKITICSSARFIDEAKKIKEKLENNGIDTELFPEIIQIDGKKIHVLEFYRKRKISLSPSYSKIKKSLMKNYLKKIESSDGILVLNYGGYIGGNTFLEMGVAFYLEKKIYLWEPASENLPYLEEIVSMEPIILNKDLEKIIK